MTVVAGQGVNRNGWVSNCKYAQKHRPYPDGRLIKRVVQQRRQCYDVIGQHDEGFCCIYGVGQKIGLFLKVDNFAAAHLKSCLRPT